MNYLQLANQISDNLTTKTRPDGTDYIVVKDTCPADISAVIKTACFEATKDSFNLDYGYKFISEAASAMSEASGATYDAMLEELDNLEADIYTSDLTKWLNDNNNHVYYLTEALEEYGTTDGFKALSLAQEMHKREVAQCLLDAMQAFIEEEAE